MRPVLSSGLLVLALAFCTTASATAPAGWGAIAPRATPLSVLDLPTLSDVLAPELNVTLLAAIVADDGDGEVGPGERVRYNGVLSNPGDATATGVSFEIALDPNLTLDAASVVFAPIAIDDPSYTTNQDTPLTVTQAGGGTLDENDFDLDTTLPAGPVTAVSGQATTEGGSVDISADGGFTYTPPLTFTGQDTFTYTITDSDGLTDTATATVDVQGRTLWFVDDDAAPGGNGSMDAPFQDHTQLNGAGGTGDVDEPGHTIFFYEGTYDINDSFHLEPGQKIVGQGVDLVVAGNVIVSGSPGQTPSITHDTGRKVILSTDNELAGFNVGTPTTPVGGIGIDGAAGGYNTLVVDAMAIYTDGGDAIHLNGGTSVLDFTSITAATSSNNGMSFVGGTHTVTVSGATTITGQTNSGLFVQNAPGSSFTFGATSVSGGARGLFLDGNGTSPFVFGDTDVSGASGLGIEIRNASASYTFAAGSSIASTGGNALHVQDGSMTVGFNGSITNAAGKSIYVRNNAAAVTVGGSVTDTGTGIQADGSVGDATINLNGNLDLDTTTNTGLMANDGGTINANGANNAITTTTGSAISCTGGSTLAGTFHDVDVNSGGAVSGGNGVHFDTCAGTKSFVDVDVSTNAFVGFFASSSGTVQVTGMSGAQALSSVATTNAPAVRLLNTTVGAAGVAFRSVSASNSSSGLVLDNTGSSGTFSVTGVGPSDPSVAVGVRGREGFGNGSGGTISSMSTDGISLTSANNVVLRHMVVNSSTDDGIQAATVSGLVVDNVRISGTGTHGIRGTSVTNLTVLNSELVSAGNAADEDAMNIVGLFGNSSVTNTVIDEHSSQGIFVSNGTRTSASTPDRLVVRNTSVTDSDPNVGAVGIEYNSVSPTIPLGTALANFELQVLDSEIRRIEGAGILVAPQGQSGDKAHLDVRRTTIVGSGGAANIEVPTAVQVNPNLNGSATFNIEDNANFTNLATTAIILKNDSNGSLEGYVTDNTVSANGSAFQITGDGASGATMVAGSTVVSMTGNTMTGQTGGNGASISAQDNTGVTTDVTFQNNTLNALRASGIGSGLAIDAQGSGNTTCVNYNNNTINAPNQFESVGLFPQSGGRVNLQGLTGFTTTAVQNFIDARTTEVPPTPNSFAFPSSGGTFGAATCATPGFTPSALTAALPELATDSPEAVALAAPKPAPMPAAETLREPRARRQSVDLGRALPEAGRVDEVPQPSVEISDRSAATVITIADLPAGVASTFAFEATAGQTIKTATLSTTVNVSSANASTASQTATIESHPSRFVSDTDGAGWRHLGIPAEGFTVDDLAQFNLVQCIPGYYENQGVCPRGSAENLFTNYDGTNLVPASGPTEALPRGRGIYWYLFDEAFDPNEPNPGPSPSQSYELPMTLFATGPVPPGNVNVSLHDDGNRWNMLANPFPKDLDISGIGGWTVGGTLQTPIGQVWNPATGSFSLTSNQDDKVAAWQGVFIRNFDAVSLTFMESAQVADAPFLGRAPASEPARRGVSFALTAETATGTPTTDEAISVAFDPVAHPGRDGLDVDKLAPPVETFALGAFEDEAGDLLAQRSLPYEMEQAIEVPLHVLAVGTAGTHTLSWPRVEDVPEAWTLRIEDRVTGATIDLRETSAYTFHVEAAASAGAQSNRGAQAAPAKNGPGVLPIWVPTVRLPEASASFAGGGTGARFVLVVGPGEPEGSESVETGPEAVALGGAFPNPFTSTTTLRYSLPGAAHVRLATYDVLGREVATLVDAEQVAGNHTAVWSPRGLASGTYVVRLRVQTAGGAAVERSLRVTHSR